VLLALSFPRFGHPAIGWIALAPLMLALVSGQRRTALRESFLLGLTTGAIYFTGTLYWITRVMVVYGGLSSWAAVLVNAALIAYLALFPALFAVVVGRLAVAHGVRALVAAPLVWVATELGRTYLLTGFPWVLLGYSQATVIPIAQQARVPILFGSDQVVWKSQNGLRVADRMYNSAFLLRSDGTTAGIYRKLHLVPFGEYVPLRGLLFFAAPLVEAIGSGFAPG